MNPTCKRGHPLVGENVRMYRGSRICKACARDHARAHYERRKAAPLTPCTRCRTALRQRNSALCRDCENKYQREWYANGGRESGKAVRAAERRRRDGQLATTLKAKYGLSLAQYEEMVDAQGGRCVICRQEPSARLVVDHDHTSGAVRGLLCQPCNAGIGMLRDDPAIALRAAAYLSGADE